MRVKENLCRRDDFMIANCGVLGFIFTCKTYKTLHKRWLCALIGAYAGDMSSLKNKQTSNGLVVVHVHYCKMMKHDTFSNYKIHPEVSYI